MKLWDAFLDWATEGGFGRFVYKFLAGMFAVAFVTEVAANGLTYMAYVYGCLMVAMIVCLYSDD